MQPAAIVNRSWGDRIVFWGIVVLVFFSVISPLFSEKWIDALLQMSVFFLLLLWVTSEAFFSGASEIRWVKNYANGCLIILSLIAAMSVIPLYAQWVESLSPKAYENKLQAWMILGEYSKNALPSYGLKMSTAYNVHGAVSGLMSILAYGGIFFLTLNTAISKFRMNVLTCSLFSSTGLCIGGLYLIAGRNIQSVCIPAIFVLTLFPAVWTDLKKQHRQRFVPGSKNFVARIQRFRMMLQNIVFVPFRLIVFLAASCAAVYWFFICDRTLVYPFLIAMAGVIVFLTNQHPYRKYSVLILIYSICVAIHVLLAGPVELIAVEQHDPLWKTFRTVPAISMIFDYPLLGTGAGGVEYVLPRYAAQVWEKTRLLNGWMLTAASLGVPAFATVTMIIFWYIFSINHVRKKRKELYALGVGAGCFGCCFFIIAVAFFRRDLFGFQAMFPAAMLAAVGYAATRRKRQNLMETFTYKKRSVQLSALSRVCLLLISLIVMTPMIYISLGRCFAGINISISEGRPFENDSAVCVHRLETAMTFDTLNANYPLRLADCYAKMKADPSERRKLERKRVVLLETAVRLNPADGMTWFELGTVYSRLKHDPYAYLNRWLPKADRCFDMAVYFLPENENLLLDTVRYWIWRSKTLSENSDDYNKNLELKTITKPLAIEKFKNLAARLLILNPNRLDSVVHEIKKHYDDNHIIQDIINDNPTDFVE